MMSTDFTPKSHDENFVKLQRQISFHAKKLKYFETHCHGRNFVYYTFAVEKRASKTLKVSPEAPFIWKLL